MSDDDSSEKSHEATEQKLLEARKKGDFVKSTDLHTAASYAGLCYPSGSQHRRLCLILDSSRAGF